MTRKNVLCSAFAVVVAGGLVLYASLSRGKDYPQVLDRYGVFSVAAGIPGGIASDGTNFLVVQQAADGRIQGALIASGSPGPSSFPVLLQTIDVGRTGGVPRVAFDGANYLMVWPDMTEPPADIFGQFISQAGMPVGSPFPIESDAGVVEAGGLAFDGTNYLAVWASNGGDTNSAPSVQGRLIGTDGTLIGSRIQISEASTPQKLPVVAASRDEFLVVWTGKVETTNAWSVLGRAISRNGSPAQSVAISQVPAQEPWPPTVASDGTNWLAVWTRETGPFPFGIPWPSNTFLPMLHGRVVMTDGTTPSPEFEIRRGGVGTFHPSVGFNGRHYLVGWAEQTAGRLLGPPYTFERASLVFIGQLDSAGQPVTTEMRIGYGAGTSVSGLAVGNTANQGIIMWRYTNWPIIAGMSFVPRNPGQPVLRNFRLLPTGASQFDIDSKPGIGVGVQSSTNLRDWSLVLSEPGFRTTGPGTYTTETPPGGSGSQRFFRTIDGRTACIENLRLINRAKVQWALEKWRTDTDVPMTSDLFGPGRYLPEVLVCPIMGGAYDYGQVLHNSTCPSGTTYGHTQ